MLTVRFHLGQGPNYMKWQVKDGKTVTYHDPETTQLWMRQCRLRNQPGTARKIYAGEDKKVCAWVDCEEVHAFPAGGMPPGLEAAMYNPRIAPHWRDSLGRNIDGKQWACLSSNGRKLGGTPL